MLTGLTRPFVIPRLRAKGYNAHGANAPVRYTKGDCLAISETKSRPPESRGF